MSYNTLDCRRKNFLSFRDLKRRSPKIDSRSSLSRRPWRAWTRPLQLPPPLSAHLGGVWVVGKDGWKGEVVENV